MTNRQGTTMDGFGKVKPITEGYVVKGGVNSVSRITTRPPAPQPMQLVSADPTILPSEKK